MYIGKMEPESSTSTDELKWLGEPHIGYRAQARCGCRCESDRAVFAEPPPTGLREQEIETPLHINGVKAVDFIRRAYDLGNDCNGPGRFDLSDPIQTELRHIQGWIQMAQADALDARRYGHHHLGGPILVRL